MAHLFNRRLHGDTASQPLIYLVSMLLFSPLNGLILSVLRFMTFLCLAPLSCHANYGATKASCLSLGGKWFEGGAGGVPESESLGQRWGNNGAIQERR